MKTLYDIINESKNISDRVFKVVGSDDTIDSVWPNEQDAKLCVKEFIEQFNKDIIKGIGYQAIVNKTCYIKKEVIK